MNNTVITVINLPDSVGSLFGGVTKIDLDLPESFSIRLNKSVEQLSILNKISTEGVLGFSVPFTPKNDRVFAEYVSPVALNVTTVFFEIQIVVNGSALHFSRLFVRGCDRRAREWNLDAARDPNHWVELSSQVKTNDLDFGTFQMTRSNIIASWPNAAYVGDYTDLLTGSPVYWPLIDFGGWCDQTTKPDPAKGRFKAVAVEDFRPMLSWIYILQSGFCAIGWTIESALFELDVIRRLWVYALRPDYYVASENLLGGRVTGQIYTRTLFNNGDFLLLEDVTVLGDYAVIQGGLPTLRFCGVKNYAGVSLKYRFFFTGEFHNDRALPFFAYFSVMEIEDVGGTYEFTGELISDDPLEVEFAAGQRIQVTFEQTVTLKPNQMAAIHIPVLPQTTPGFFVEAGFYFEVTPENQSFMTDDIVDIRLAVSDEMSILDWLKAFIHVTNGKLSTDWNTKTVTILPNKTSNIWGETVGGFLLRENPVIDLDDVVVDDSVILTPVRPDLKRFTRFQFKDSTDAYISTLSLSEPPHSRTILNSVDLKNEVEKIENPFIEPTIEGIPDGIASGSGGRQPFPRLPRFWDNTDGNRSFDIKPRILYAYGEVKQVNPEPKTSTDLYSSFFFDELPNVANSGLVQSFGYATQSPTWNMTPVPSVIVDFVFGVKSTDLFTIFYLGYTQDARSGTIADVLIRMNMARYSDIDFRSLYRFNIKGIPIIAPMIDIRDFSSAENIPTPVKFFVEPAVLDCCDLPCGCQFIECEYYQDMSATMRQSTLDDLKLSSFVIDGIEYVSTPVAFGTIKIIDIGGKPYVTNLVDILNAIGAPYFSFNYSTRLHPEKGLRFFKMKHLVCHDFEIMITESGVDAYRFTNTSQQQAVFQVGFDQNGYGTEFMDVPENCINTTEY